MIHHGTVDLTWPQGSPLMSRKPSSTQPSWNAEPRLGEEFPEEDS